MQQRSILFSPINPCNTSVLPLPAQKTLLRLHKTVTPFEPQVSFPAFGVHTLVSLPVSYTYDIKVHVQNGTFSSRLFFMGGENMSWENGAKPGAD